MMGFSGKKKWRLKMKSETGLRWIKILRHKASRYEHEARGRKEVVTDPCLDTIANEIFAFFEGLESK